MAATKEYLREWRKANRERVNEYLRVYRKLNPPGPMCVTCGTPKSERGSRAKTPYCAACQPGSPEGRARQIGVPKPRKA